MKRSKHSKLIPALCALAALLVILIAVVIVLETSKKNGQDPSQTTDGAMMEFETPYCLLQYPKQWEDQLDFELVENDGCRARFSWRTDGGQLHRLFDVSFDSGDGVLLGFLETGDGAVEVYLQVHEPEAGMSDQDREVYWAMQEGVNELIDRLPLKDGTVDENDTGDVVIHTPYCQLIYPGAWKEYLHVEQAAGSEYTVDFYAVFEGVEKIPLFTVAFDREAEGATLVITGTDGNDVGVYTYMPPAPDSGLSDDQMNVIYAMQEAFNDVLDGLTQN